jgi:hypothetical protein
LAGVARNRPSQLFPLQVFTRQGFTPKSLSPNQPDRAA